METVWNNLVSNAIKYTAFGGEISITLKKDNQKTIATVSDNGCGMSDETIEHCFEKFYQGDSSHSQEGNGLGLALVRQVINILDGEIKVSSVLGEGTEFTIII